MHPILLFQYPPLKSHMPRLQLKIPSTQGQISYWLIDRDLECTYRTGNAGKPAQVSGRQWKEGWVVGPGLLTRRMGPMAGKALTW